MKKLYVLTAVILTMVFSFTANSFGERKDNPSNDFDGKIVQNFIMGINSENLGLCKSSIYYAGYYKITGTVEALINVLNDNSRKPCLRILAAVSLYRIGDMRGIRAIRDVVQFDKIKSVKSKCSEIYNSYLNQNDIFYSTAL